MDGLLHGLRARDGQERPIFPMLGGPKVSRMWIRMLVAPGGARIDGIDALPVAVDVQVLKVTKYLGLLSVDGAACVGPTRDAVQAVWRADVAAGGTEGPSELGSSCASLDPALWFFGKWGCTHCERVGRRVPVVPICARCRFAASKQ